MKSDEPASAGSDAAAAKRPAAPSPQTELIIDTDVHHSLAAKEDLYPFLPSHSRERLAEHGLPRLGNVYYQNGGYQGIRADCLKSPDEDSAAARSSFSLFQEKLLGACGVNVAILNGELTAAFVTLADADYSADLCRAFNDWTVANWLSKDDRFRCALTVPMHQPEAAVREIERLGGHPGVVGIYVICGSPRLYGQRCFDRVYAACVEHGLVVALHFSGEGAGMNPPPTAAGFPSYYAETYLLRPQFYQAHLSSFLFEGTFEKFPSLRVVFLESGFAWVPAFRWRADTAWKALRSQTPWVKRLPSEYIDAHVRFSTQPMEEPASAQALGEVLEWMHGANSLMFASDFPHWDFDAPATVAQCFPAAMRRQVLSGNALQTYPKLHGLARA
ncbi:MAG: amidohydrolase [Opitutaceae bacterium]|nr:amidohydrolase [Opitutaceae bacterium]